jgi:hypothetical protein
LLHPHCKKIKKQKQNKLSKVLRFPGFSTLFLFFFTARRTVKTRCSPNPNLLLPTINADFKAGAEKFLATEIINARAEKIVLWARLVTFKNLNMAVNSKMKVKILAPPPTLELKNLATLGIQLKDFGSSGFVVGIFKVMCEILLSTFSTYLFQIVEF